MSRNFFYCDTPYQIFNVINIVTLRCKGCENTIAVYHQFQGSQEICERLKKSSVFTNVYDIYPSKNNWEDILGLIFTRRLCKKIIKEEGRNYDKVYFSCLDTSASLALYSSLNYKEAVLFEDGTGTYKGNILYDYMSFRRLWLLKILHNSVKYFNFSLLLVYAPNMLASNLNIPTDKIEIGDKGLQNTIFNYRENTIYSRRFVYLDQPYKNNEKIILDKKATEFLKNFSNNLVIRKHPRMSDTVFSCGVIDNYNNNWELECLHQIGDKHVLISIYSTSIFQPAVINGKNPTLIFLFLLYKALFDEKRLNEMQRHISSFANSFSKTRIYIPKSWNEFQDVLIENVNA